MSTPQTRPRDSSRTPALIFAGLIIAAECRAQERFEPVALASRITHVQPMTGIVLWTTSEHNRTASIQLEYSYMKYGDVVTDRGRYDWGVMDRLLDKVASRRHQAIVRFYFVYPGNPTTVPATSKPSPTITRRADGARTNRPRFPTGRTASSRSSRSTSTRSWRRVMTTTLGWPSSRPGSASGPSITSTADRCCWARRSRTSHSRPRSHANSVAFSGRRPG